MDIWHKKSSDFASNIDVEILKDSSYK